MVDKYDRLRKNVTNGVESRSGTVRVVMDVPVSVKEYSGEEVSDEDVETEAIQAIQEGKGRVISMD